MKRIVLLSIAFIICLSVMGCTGTNNATTSTETSIAKTPATEAPTENPVELAKAKLASAVEECYTSKYGDYSWRYDFITIPSDGSSITVDTNPDNSKYGYSYEDEALECIQAINEYLALPSAVWSKMNSTNSLDGTQSQDCGEYTVTWRYHPNNGLEVIYEVNLH